MHFFTNEPIQNSITRLFASDPHPPIESVAFDSELAASIRAEIPELINYLVMDDVLPTLLKWALTPEKPDCDNSERLVRASVLIFSTVSNSLMEKLQDNETFINSLQSCMNTNMQSNLQICGHFQRIIENMVRYTNGGFLQHFPNICSFIISKIEILALKELLLRLLTDFSDAFTEDEYEKIVVELAAQTRRENGYFAVVLMRDVLKEKKATLSFFQNDKILRELLTAATSQEKKEKFHSLFEASIFQLIERIAKDFPCATPVIAEFSKKYKFNANEITCGTVNALRIFKEGIYTLMPRFFQEPYITMLNSLIFSKLREIPDKQLGGIVDNFKIAENIMNSFDQNQVNGHLTDLAIFLEKKSKISKTLQTEEWKHFISEKLAPRDQQRIVEEMEDDEPLTFMANGRKPTLAPNFSFGGGGGIKAMMQFAQAQMNKQQAQAASFKKPKKPKDEELSEVGESKTFNLGELIGDQTKLSKAPEKNSHTNMKSGIAAGFSFSIPTVYQADDVQTPMVC